MSYEIIVSRLKDLNATLTGVQTSFDSPPEYLNQGDLPAAVILPNEFTYDMAADRLARTDHKLRVGIYVVQRDTSVSLPYQLSLCTPFINRMRDLYAAHIKLTDVNGANHVADFAQLQGGKIGVTEYAGVPIVGIMFDLLVVEKEAVVVNA